MRCNNSSWPPGVLSDSSSSKLPSATYSSLHTGRIPNSSRQHTTPAATSSASAASHTDCRALILADLVLSRTKMEHSKFKYHRIHSRRHWRKVRRGNSSQSEKRDRSCLAFARALPLPSRNSLVSSSSQTSRLEVIWFLISVERESCQSKAEPFRQRDKTARISFPAKSVIRNQMRTY